MVCVCMCVCVCVCAAGEEVDTEADELVEQVLQAAGLSLTAGMSAAPSSRPEPAAALVKHKEEQREVDEKEVSE
jgi:division protein CdvB (Snf7/Vps24/ESCRT-III family)